MNSGRCCKLTIRLAVKLVAKLKTTCHDCRVSDQTNPLLKIHQQFTYWHQIKNKYICRWHKMASKVDKYEDEEIVNDELEHSKTDQLQTSWNLMWTNVVWCPQRTKQKHWLQTLWAKNTCY